MTTRAKRGPYAKTEAKRAEILRVAFEAYAASGRQGPSIKSIAEACGLSEAGVLHHFSSKDELLVAILKARDEIAGASFDLETLEGTASALAQSTQTPGLVKLFVDMTAAAADPDHPAAEFMRNHSATVQRLLLTLLGEGAEWEARVLLSAAEGLQIQWMRDPSIDVEADLIRLYTTLVRDLPEAVKPKT